MKLITLTTTTALLLGATTFAHITPPNKSFDAEIEHLEGKILETLSMHDLHPHAIPHAGGDHHAADHHAEGHQADVHHGKDSHADAHHSEGHGDEAHHAEGHDHEHANPSHLKRRFYNPMYPPSSPSYLHPAYTHPSYYPHPASLAGYHTRARLRAAVAHHAAAAHIGMLHDIHYHNHLHNYYKSLQSKNKSNGSNSNSRNSKGQKSSSKQGSR